MYMQGSTRCAYDTPSNPSIRKLIPFSFFLSFNCKTPAPSESIHRKNSLSNVMNGFFSAASSLFASSSKTSERKMRDNLSEPDATAFLDSPNRMDIHAYFSACIPEQQTPDGET